MTTSNDSLSIRCDLTAIPISERDAHMARAARLLFQAHEEQLELPNGLAWRFAAVEYDEVAAYVANERRCCPFFTFTLEVTPGQGPIWLRITGNQEMKAFLQAELVAHEVH